MKLINPARFNKSVQQTGYMRILITFARKQAPLKRLAGFLCVLPTRYITPISIWTTVNRILIITYLLAPAIYCYHPDTTLFVSSTFCLWPLCIQCNECPVVMYVISMYVCMCMYVYVCVCMYGCVYMHIS